MDEAGAGKVAEAGLFGGALPSTAAAARAAAPPGYLGHRARLRRRLVGGGRPRCCTTSCRRPCCSWPQRRDAKSVVHTLVPPLRRLRGRRATLPNELRAVAGLGEAGFAALKAVEAAALRLGRAEIAKRSVLHDWELPMGCLAAAPAREHVEQFRVLFLDPLNRLPADEVQGRGTVDHTPAHPRGVVRRALEVGAMASILVHNHRGGDPRPSRADLEMTAGIKAAAGVFGIALHDHLIIGRGRHA